MTRKVDIDGTRYSLSPGWLGCVPFHDGMTFEQLEKEVLPQNLPVSFHHKNVNFNVCRSIKDMLIEGLRARVA